MDSDYEDMTSFRHLSVAIPETEKPKSSTKKPPKDPKASDDGSKAAKQPASSSKKNLGVEKATASKKATPAATKPPVAAAPSNKEKAVLLPKSNPKPPASKKAATIPKSTTANSPEKKPSKTKKEPSPNDISNVLDELDSDSQEEEVRSMSGDNTDDQDEDMEPEVSSKKSSQLKDPIMVKTKPAPPQDSEDEQDEDEAEEEEAEVKEEEEVKVVEKKVPEKKVKSKVVEKVKEKKIEKPAAQNTTSVKKPTLPSQPSATVATKPNSLQTLIDKEKKTEISAVREADIYVKAEELVLPSQWRAMFESKPEPATKGNLATSSLRNNTVNTAKVPTEPSKPVTKEQGSRITKVEKPTPAPVKPTVTHTKLEVVKKTEVKEVKPIVPKAPSVPRQIEGTKIVLNQAKKSESSNDDKDTEEGDSEESEETAQEFEEDKEESEEAAEESEQEASEESDEEPEEPEEPKNVPKFSVNKIEPHNKRTKSTSEMKVSSVGDRKKLLLERSGTQVCSASFQKQGMVSEEGASADSPNIAERKAQLQIQKPAIKSQTLNTRTPKAPTEIPRSESSPVITRSDDEEDDREEAFEFSDYGSTKDMIGKSLNLQQMANFHQNKDKIKINPEPVVVENKPKAKKTFVEKVLAMFSKKKKKVVEPVEVADSDMSIYETNAKIFLGGGDDNGGMNELSEDRPKQKVLNEDIYVRTVVLPSDWKNNFKSMQQEQTKNEEKVEVQSDDDESEPPSDDDNEVQEEEDDNIYE